MSRQGAWGVSLVSLSWKSMTEVSILGVCGRKKGQISE